MHAFKVVFLAVGVSGAGRKSDLHCDNFSGMQLRKAWGRGRENPGLGFELEAQPLKRRWAAVGGFEAKGNAAPGHGS